MFLTDNDYRVVVGESAFKAISQASHDIILRAEQEAIEEMAGYLRPKYDTHAIFAQEGDERNAQVVMVAADIALYHMASSMPSRMGYEVREARYRRAVAWLEGVAAGKIVPELPLDDGTEGDGDAATGKTHWSSAWKRDNQW